MAAPAHWRRAAAELLDLVVVALLTDLLFGSPARPAPPVSACLSLQSSKRPPPDRTSRLLLVLGSWVCVRQQFRSAYPPPASYMVFWAAGC